MAKITLVAWAHGDATVGDGTFNAKFELDVGSEEDAGFIKSELKGVLSVAWDLQERFIHVMTQEEFDEYTSDHDACE